MSSWIFLFLIRGESVLNEADPLVRDDVRVKEWFVSLTKVLVWLEVVVPSRIGRLLNEFQTNLVRN